MLPRRARAPDVASENEVTRQSSVLDVFYVSGLSGLAEEPSQEQNPLAILWVFPLEFVGFISTFGSLDLFIRVALDKNLGEVCLTGGKLSPPLQALCHVSKG